MKYMFIIANGKSEKLDLDNIIKTKVIEVGDAAEAEEIAESMGRKYDIDTSVFYYSCEIPKEE